MFRKSVLIIALLILMGGDCGYAQSEIRFHLPDFPPYTFEKDGKIQGIGVEFVDKILKEAKIRYSLELTSNYGRAVYDVKAGNSDGFFMASQNIERDEIAHFSNPVLINRWCWFFPANSTLNPKDASFKAEVRAGTYLHSNTHKWLIKNGYNVTGAVSKIESLPKMLKHNRINAIFIAEVVFFEVLGQTGETPENYKKAVQVEKPFGIYISKDYLSKNPGIMEKINTAINKVIANKN